MIKKPMHWKDMSEAEIAWLAGLFEGEGYVGAHITGGRNTRHKTPMVQVAINMTDLDVLEKVLELTGEGKVYGPYRHRSPNRKPFYVWRLLGVERVEYLYHLMLPWLCSRRKSQFDEAIEGWLLDKVISETKPSA